VVSFRVMGRRLGVTVLILAFGLLAARPSAAAGVPIEKASKEQLKAAQRTFEAADGLFDAKRYEQAITTYRASYDIVASPNSRLQIARALEALGRLDEAYAELAAAVADAKKAAAADSKYEPTLKAAVAELQALESKVGHVQVTLGGDLADAKVTIGSRELGPEELSGPVVVSPGSVTVSAALPDGRTATREVSVDAGATVPVELQLEPPKATVAPAPSEAPTPAHPPPPASETGHSSLRPFAYIAGGVGVAGLATFAVFGLMNKSRFDDLDSSCNGGHCSPDRQSDIDAGRRYQSIANVGLVVGVVGVGAGATLFVLSSGAKKSEQTGRVQVRVAPTFATVSGRF
jgi:hypothetical protein